MSDKCSFKGSGLCGKCPFGVQYNSTHSTFNSFNKAGIKIPPVEFTASTTTLKLAFLMASTSTNSKFKTS